MSSASTISISSASASSSSSASASASTRDTSHLAKLSLPNIYICIYFIAEDVLDMPMPAQVVLPEGEPGQSVSVSIKGTAFLQVGALFEARLVDVEVETGWLYSD